MRIVTIDKLSPDMRVGKTVYSQDWRVMLPEGAFLRESYISRLKELGYHYIYVKDELCEDLEERDIIPEKVKIDAVKATQALFDGVKKGIPMDLGKAKGFIDKFIDYLLTNRDMMVNYFDLPGTVDYQISHSVNVSIISLLVGIGLGYTVSELSQLGLGALLHDVGQMVLPEEVIYKKGRLTAEEFEVMKTHCKKGYDLIRQDSTVSLLTAHVAWQHHEAFDGFGYPRGLQSKDIHEYARIVAIAEVYASLTALKVFQRQFLPHEAMEIVMAGNGSLFDPEIMQVFSENVPTYPVGTLVQLTTGEEGIVIRNSKKASSRPTLRLLKDAEGNPLPDKPEFRLDQNHTVFVARTL